MAHGGGDEGLKGAKEKLLAEVRPARILGNAALRVVVNKRANVTCGVAQVAAEQVARAAVAEAARPHVREAAADAAGVHTAAAATEPSATVTI